MTGLRRWLTRRAALRAALRAAERGGYTLSPPALHQARTEAQAAALAAFPPSPPRPLTTGLAWMPARVSPRQPPG